MLSAMLMQKNYDGIKEEFLQRIEKSIHYNNEEYKLHKLGLKYTRNILSIIFLIDNNLEWGDKTYCELEAYNICLNDCITVIETDFPLYKFINQLEHILVSNEETLHTGFLSSSKDIMETNVELNIRKNFRLEIENIINLL